MKWWVFRLYLKAGGDSQVKFIPPPEYHEKRCGISLHPEGSLISVSLGSLALKENISALNLMQSKNWTSKGAQSNECWRLGTNTSVTTEPLKSVTLAWKGITLRVKLIHQQLQIHDVVIAFWGKRVLRSTELLHKKVSYHLRLSLTLPPWNLIYFTI